MARIVIILLITYTVSLSALSATVNCMLAEPPNCSTTATRQIIAQARALGIATVRVRADWARIQPKAGRWEFSWLDALVEEAREAGIEVVLVLGPSPAWTVSYLKNPSPAELARAHPDVPAFEEYARTVAKRYRTRVQYYQVWERSSATALLATQEDVYALFRCASQAIHGVDPKLRVIVPEPGDVDICWISNYLKTTRGQDMPDVLLLSPTRSALRPEVFWWRVPALRAHVMPKYPALVLWEDISLKVDSPDITFTIASAALLDGIPAVNFSPESLIDITDHRLASGIKALAGLQEYTYVGWTLIGEDAPAGVFQNKQSMYTLALPLGEGRIAFVPSKLPLPTGLAVPDTQVSLTPLGEEKQKLMVTEKRELLVNRKPMLMTGVSLKPMDGTPDVLLASIFGQEVSLDVTGEEPSGLHLLPDLPGGHFEQEVVSGHTFISTVRGKAPWIHVDVPDGFLFFNVKRIPLEVTIDVMGVAQAEKTGVNLYYDAQGNMQHSKWQWIDVGPEKVFSYTFRLNDALFANRAGYDFRINMGGSKEDVRVVGIRVRKVKET